MTIEHKPDVEPMYAHPRDRPRLRFSFDTFAEMIDSALEDVTELTDGGSTGANDVPTDIIHLSDGDG